MMEEYQLLFSLYFEIGQISVSACTKIHVYKQKAYTKSFIKNILSSKV